MTTAYCILYEDNYQGDLVGPFVFHPPPANFEQQEGDGRRISITGHFDDPAAQRCEQHPLEGDEPEPPELIVLGCRGAFVVTQIEDLSQL